MIASRVLLRNVSQPTHELMPTRKEAKIRPPVTLLSPRFRLGGDSCVMLTQ